MNSNPDSRSLFRPEDLKRIERSTFVRTLEHHATLASTNDRALALVASPNLRTPALILAGEQTAGRGRGSHRWWSTRGSLTFSLILGQHNLRRELPWSQWSLTAGLAVCQALHDLRPGLEIGLKWPNDVLVRGRKICGILVEAQSYPANHAILGIGVNVNNSFLDQATPFRNVATSLQDVCGYTFSLTDVLIHILIQLESSIHALATNAASLSQKWRMLCVLTGHHVQVDAGSQRTQGLCLGIDDDGALLIESASGRTRCTSGVVTRFDG